MLTGQGKTLIIRLLALKLVVLDGRKIDVLTSTKDLARRDAGLAQSLYSLFKVSAPPLSQKS